MVLGSSPCVYATFFCLGFWDTLLGRQSFCLSLLSSLSVSSFRLLSLHSSLYLFFPVQLVRSAQILFPSFSLCKLYRGNTSDISHSWLELSSNRRSLFCYSSEDEKFLIHSKSDDEHGKLWCPCSSRRQLCSLLCVLSSHSFKHLARIKAIVSPNFYLTNTSNKAEKFSTKISTNLWHQQHRRSTIPGESPQDSSQTSHSLFSGKFPVTQWCRNFRTGSSGLVGTSGFSTSGLSLPIGLSSTALSPDLRDSLMSF